MHCSSCASNIERSLGKTHGVKKVNVSLLLKKASAECEDNVSEEELKKAVRRAGYEVKTVEFE